MSSSEVIVLQTVLSFPPISWVGPGANAVRLYFQMPEEYSNDNHIYPSDSEKKFSMT